MLALRSPRALSVNQLRIFAALVVSITVAWSVYLFLTPLNAANDLQWLYAAAHIYRNGGNPYHTLGTYIPASWSTYNTPLFYPFPAVMLVLPLSYVPPVVAGATFSAISAALLAYALLSTGETWRLLTLLSAPAVVAFGNVQWSPLMLAACWLPALACLAVCKPTAGLAPLVVAPRWSTVAAMASIGILSVAMLPTWPLDWLRNLGRAEHIAPAFYGVPGLLLASVLAWRLPQGRAFLAWAVVPSMVFFYDALLLYFLPANKWEQLALTVASWIAFIGFGYAVGGDITLNPTMVARGYEYVCLYLPAFALLMVRWYDTAVSDG